MNFFPSKFYLMQRDSNDKHQKLSRVDKWRDISFVFLAAFSFSENFLSYQGFSIVDFNVNTCETKAVSFLSHPEICS